MEPMTITTTRVDGEERFLILFANEGLSSLKRTVGPMTEAEFRDLSRDLGLDDAKIDEQVRIARRNPTE